MSHRSWVHLGVSTNQAQTSQNNALNEEHDILILQTMRKTKNANKATSQVSGAAKCSCFWQARKKQKTFCGRLKYPQMTPKLPDVFFFCVFFLPYVNFKLHSYGKSPF